MAGEQPGQVFALLQTVAGPYAGRVVRLWPDAYDGYLPLPAARRHLAHIYMNRIGRAPGFTAERFVRDATYARTGAFIAFWAPDAPKFLPQAAKKLGERGWRPAEYRLLVGLLGQGGEKAGAIAHAASITPDFVVAIERLPLALVAPGITRWLRNAAEANLIREAAEIVRRVRGPDAVEAMLSRLRRAKSREAVFGMLADELTPDALPAPFEPTERLKPLRNRSEVVCAGLRFRNCLASCLHRAAFDRSAFVEWTGPEPAMLELEYGGAAGWRLAVALGVNNRALSPATRRAIESELEGLGVRVGRDPFFVLDELRDLAGA